MSLWIAITALVFVSPVMAGPSPAPARVLRICADPNNLPFSSEHTPGFENQIADVLADELHARVEYTWWAERRGFFRNTLKEKACDVVIGVPVGIPMARTTAPYYRSSYVFVTRADRKLAIRSLDDPQLATLKIGVQLGGDDGANPPPVHALSRRGIIDNVRGYVVTGDYTKEAPAAEVMRAVADGTVDVGIAWGPLAGGFAKRAATKLVITPIAERRDGTLPMTFDIAVGVRRGDTALAAELDRALVARRAEIAKILDVWRVPRLPLEDATR